MYVFFSFFIRDSFVNDVANALAELERFFVQWMNDLSATQNACFNCRNSYGLHSLWNMYQPPRWNINYQLSVFSRKLANFELWFGFHCVLIFVILYLEYFTYMMTSTISLSNNCFDFIISWIANLMPGNCLISARRLVIWLKHL